MNEKKPANVEVYKKLSKIQAKAVVPKANRNDFARYNFRSAEDILDFLRPLLAEAGVVLLFRDKVVLMEGKEYMRSQVHFIDSEHPDSPIVVSGYARTSESKGGMSPEQVTGSTSSYARKYALTAMFAIGGEQDDDALNEATKGSKAPNFGKAVPPRKPAQTASPRKETAKAPSALEDPEKAGAVAFTEEQKLLNKKKAEIRVLMPDAKKKEDFETAFELIIDKKEINTLEDADKVLEALKVDIPEDL